MRSRPTCKMRSAKSIEVAILRTVSALCGLALCLGAASAHSRHSASWSVKEERTRTESIPIDGATRVIVDNIHGDVRLTGHAGREVTVRITETLRARDQAAADRSRREVSLDVKHKGDGIVICADGPFRPPEDCTGWRRNWQDHADYQVAYDLEIEVPRKVNLEVGTVEGEIEISGVTGDFQVAGVNGSVALSGMRGSGEARSVNGFVKVSFDENPTEDCRFHTINGNIEVSFQDGLCADMTFKTMNGEVLTDFDYERLPPEPVRIERPGRGTRFRLEARSGIRIGDGGPRFEFENINGKILVRRNP